jgi:mycothiol synthase
MVRIWNDSRIGLPSQSPVNADEVRAETFLDKDYDPEGAWLAIVEGMAVGYANGFVDQARLKYGLNDSYVVLEVKRSHRGDGIEESLLERSLDYLAGRGVASTQTPYYQVDDWRKILLENAGFLEVRRYYEMVRDESHEPEKAAFPGDIRIERRFISDDPGHLASKIIKVRNESFVDHFNYSPVPAERLRSYFEATETSFAVTFAVDEGKTVGFVLSEDRPPEVEGITKREGWVAILGVIGSHRRRGLGRNLLLDSVSWLQSRGIERILLMVDAENEKALDMYKSAGFEVNSVEILMAKNLPE